MTTPMLAGGLCALSRAARVNGMTGHLGAAAIAARFITEDHPHLPPEVCAALKGEVDRIVRGEETVWFDPAKAGVTAADLFAPRPDEPPEPDRIPLIAEALEGNIDSLHQSGHNVIFAALALRALRARPQYATPFIVDGIRALIAGFDGSQSGRAYFGKERGWLEGEAIPLADDVRPYADEGAMARVVIDEVIGHASEHRRGAGGLHHIINHAAALIELKRRGWADLGRRGLDAHRRHIRIWRALPNLESELGSLEPAEHSPLTPPFWRGELKRDSAMLTHRLKTLYGSHVVLGLVDAAKREEAAKHFLYLMK